MFESFIKFLELGLYHILNVDSYDHILFVALISIPFLFKDWKRLLILISIFTFGHTLSLVLGIYGIINLNTSEWLIPITIFSVALFNIFTAGKTFLKESNLVLAIVLIFGLIHGLGFANAFKSLVGSNNTLAAILEFTIGIEIGQLVVVIVVLILSFIFQNLFRFSKRDWVLVSSSIILGFILPLIFMSPLFS
jgi:hypothetical protein